MGSEMCIRDRAIEDNIEESIDDEESEVDEESEGDEESEESGDPQNDDEVSSELKAFPDAQGYGRFASGGRGGQVIKVTNLEDSGTGSLRDAVNKTGARTIIFDVSGHINLESTLVINNDNITIAGQSAPGDGITLNINGQQSPVLTITASNVIIRYITARHSNFTLPSDQGADSIFINRGSNIIIDHCSASWATDENIAIAHYGNSFVENVSIQNCIIGPAYNGNNKGTLVAGIVDKVSYYQNYFAENRIRNPRIACDDGDCPTKDVVYEVVNNVVFGAKNSSGLTSNQANSGMLQLNFVNNLSKQANGTTASRRHLMMSGKYPVKAYVSGNIDFFRTNNSMPNLQSTGSQEGVSNTDKLGSSEDISNTSFNTPIVNEPELILDATKVWGEIRNHVGASLPSRDSFDAILISDFETGTITGKNATNNFPNLESTSPLTDSDNDGIPDDW